MTPPTRIVATAGGVYTVVDAERLVSDALIVARLRGAPAGTRARTGRQHARAHLTAGHLIVTGRAELALPWLATADDAVVVTLEPPGRPALDLVLDVPMGSTLPLFPPEIEVEGTLGHLAGTVTRVAFPYAPVAAAVVRVSLPSAAMPPQPPFGLGLRTTLARDHPGGTVVQERTPMSAAPSTTVDAAAPAGATQVVLGSVAGCGPGGVLALGDPADVEHVLMGPVDAATRTVTLRAPLRRTRRPQDRAEAFTLGATAAATTLHRAARPGEGLLLTDAALAPAGVVELLAPNSADSEVRAVDAVADAQGHFRLDGLRGVDRLTLTPQDPPNPPATAVVVVLDPAHDTTYCDLTI